MLLAIFEPSHAWLSTQTPLSPVVEDEQEANAFPPGKRFTPNSKQASCQHFSTSVSLATRSSPAFFAHPYHRPVTPVVIRVSTCCVTVVHGTGRSTPRTSDGAPSPAPMQNKNPPPHRGKRVPALHDTWAIGASSSRTRTRVPLHSSGPASSMRTLHIFPTSDGSAGKTTFR